MLSVLPKHKGTEKMQADLKRRISKARKETQQAKKKGASQKPFFHVDKTGAGQVVLVGPPNSGKSSLVDALTHASPEVAEYPCTTREPVPGSSTNACSIPASSPISRMARSKRPSRASALPRL